MDQPQPAEPVVTPIDAKPAKAGKRHALVRLFGISIWGWVKLALLCVLVGFFVMASEYDPASPNTNFSVWGAVKSFGASLWALGQWAAANFWKPALAGAGIVLPLWFLWRLVSLPFRK